ncbi:hypothetical protein [Virgibacillus sp. CBA3643]|uniref:hypothetical protein n=1 Tax=Virgibacillus sp. CBA3643 TaxID=2942278 RepID=UPI0035A2858A
MGAVKAILANRQNEFKGNEAILAPENIFSMLAYDLQNTYHAYLMGTHLSKATKFKPMLSEKANEYAYHFIDNMENTVPTLEKFGIAKYYLNNFFYEVTESGSLIFSYIDYYLVTPSKAGQILGVERQTINKYKHLGLETLDTDKHNKIPKDALILWKDPIWATRLQGIGQKFKHREQSLTDYLAELYEELYQIKTKHVAPLEEVYKDIINGEVEADESIYFFGYDNWKNILEEVEYVEGKLNSEHK